MNDQSIYHSTLLLNNVLQINTYFQKLEKENLELKSEITNNKTEHAKMKVQLGEVAKQNIQFEKEIICNTNENTRIKTELIEVARNTIDMKSQIEHIHKNYTDEIRKLKEKVTPSKE